MALMFMGAQGCISVTANVVPKIFHDLCRFSMSGEKEQANSLNEGLIILNKCLFLEANPIPVKWALHQMGKIGPGIRLPLTTLDEMFHDYFRSTLEQAGISYI